MKIYKSFDIPPLSDEIHEYEKEVKEDSGEIAVNGLNDSAATRAREKRNRIDGVFDPARQLREIRSAPNPQVALQEYRDKLSFQKKGMALLYEQIVFEVRRNPDITLEKVDELIEKHGATYGFTPAQKSEVRWVMREFKDKHNAVHSTRENYPDDSKLYAYLFARPPVGRVEIEEGPLTFYIRCHDQRDYAYIYSQNFLSGIPVSERDVTIANETGGVSIGSAIQSELRGCIIAENVTRASDHHITHIHEEQHAIKRLFSSSAKKVENYYSIFEAKNDSELRACIEREFRAIRRTHEPRTADEILAYMKTAPIGDFTNSIEIESEYQGNKTASGISGEYVLQTLMTPKEKGGLYDYFRDEKERLIRRFLRDLGEEKERIIRKSAERVFVNEYQELIRQGIRVFKILLQRGFSVERVIGLLTSEPLQKWQKVVNRHYGHA